MAHPHRTDDISTDFCSLSDDARFGALYVSDVSGDFGPDDFGPGDFGPGGFGPGGFGPGAVEVSCPCGAWVIEDESGIALARSEGVAESVAWRELAGAA